MRYESCGETFVAMMQAADFRDGDHFSDLAWHDRAGVGAILVERKMRAGPLVVVNVGGQNAAQMSLVEDHDVIQARGESNPSRARRKRSAQGERGAVTTSVI